MRPDELVRLATLATARIDIAPAKEPGELAHITRSLKRELQDLTPESVATELALPVPNWKPSPGATDVVVGDTAPHTAVIEVKVYELRWCLWDLVKVASLVDGGQSKHGYLVVAATETKFHKAGGFGSNLNDHDEIRTADVFGSYAPDWLDLLRGGPGRPTRLPATLQTALVGREPLHSVPNWEIRAAKVAVPSGGGYLKFASQAWPTAHPRLADPKSPGALPSLEPPRVRLIRGLSGDANDATTP